MLVVELGGANEVVRRAEFVREVVEHKHALAKAFRPHFEARPVGRERVLADGPGALVIFKKNTGALCAGIFGVVLAIIEDCFKEPVAAPAQIFHGLTRCEVSVLDALEIAVSRTSLIGAVVFTGLGQINSLGVFRFVFVADSVALVIVTLAD